MSLDGIVGWVVLVSGYLLAFGLFAWLGGLRRAGDAIRTWGQRATQDVHAGRQV